MPKKRLMPCPVEPPAMFLVAQLEPPPAFARGSAAAALARRAYHRQHAMRCRRFSASF